MSLVVSEYHYLNNKKVKSSYFFLLLFLLLPIFSVAQDTTSIKPKKTKKQSLLSLMEYKEVIPVAIQGDITNLLEDKFNQEKRTGSFSFTDSLGKKITLPVRFETRGKTRLVRCDIPPVMIYVDKSAMKDQRIKDYPKLKVVVPCFQDSLAEDLLYRELLIYRLYAMVSDFHFRVQATELTCLDSTTQDTTHILPAFFIESDKEFRKRTDTEELNQYNVTWSDLDPEQAQITALFQYMISNTDWKIDHKHNLKYFRKDTISPLVLVPYDFDFSGFVNADYAKPNPDYGQESVRQRIYLGKRNKFLMKAAQRFLSQEAEMYKMIAEDRHLSAASKADLASFLKPFFDCLKSKRARRKAFPK